MLHHLIFKTSLKKESVLLTLIDRSVFMYYLKIRLPGTSNEVHLTLNVAIFIVMASHRSNESVLITQETTLEEEGFVSSYNSCHCYFNVRFWIHTRYITPYQIICVLQLQNNTLEIKQLISYQICRHI